MKAADTKRLDKFIRRAGPDLSMEPDPDMEINAKRKMFPLKVVLIVVPLFFFLSY